MIDVIKEIRIRTKPCRKLKYCPYGFLVEQFPLSETRKRFEERCSVYGHMCPVFILGIAAKVVDEDVFKLLRTKK